MTSYNLFCNELLELQMSMWWNCNVVNNILSCFSDVFPRFVWLWSFAVVHLYQNYIIPIIPFILTKTTIATLAATRGQNKWIKKSISLHEHLLFWFLLFYLVISVETKYFEKHKNRINFCIKTLLWLLLHLSSLAWKRNQTTICSNSIDLE